MLPSKPAAEAPIYFLGGHDLEMQEIVRVLHEHTITVVDHQLHWSHASFTAYKQEITEAIRSGHRPVLIELRHIPDSVRPFVDIIDHHGPESGRLPTSLERVLKRLGVTDLTREQRLIVANDKGYIEGLIAAGATAEEVERIRRADRTAQGITAEQEEQAAAAIAALDTSVPGLTVVQLPHARTATVTDRLNIHAGGPGYSNLLILSPTEVAFFGDGKLICLLYEKHGGYCGGQLPITGFWGLETRSEDQRKAIRADVLRHHRPG
jgi:hypothetical protein